ncbi:crotonobetainyl-CoA:carnitine CoA-transferase CaiB-like acyl-CoA transferase [Nocardioides ginsengisegetis]|uniref:Crotonobetainyl-CoA:carnitine CoA-transferase CaiB-like acyl-CoA transferase n=1 Tax=Nocardioides ginsengisegetis TaxID=661491 RepID=A0A7W3J247_9ACTN|nr:CoA transferase [Nocardioides ginsengisegetis]MBA8804903.1 crotonobetainyl-CoA:carnitine CoA-transferase CaiB-like acyl-CoA transferase [Nocardioides ginsengisegetis]
MFEAMPHKDPWVRLGDAAATRTSDEFVERIRLFGVPAAAVPEHVPNVEVPWKALRITGALAGASLDGALVVDLSSLWAGPLCGQILGRAGARVVKVESARRPDGARAGEPRLFDWLHAGQESVAVDFTLAQDRASVADLIRSADFVIEASRPRALAQLGLSHDQLDLRAGTVWVSITGYGRGRPDLVAFGDDAAAAGGLLARSRCGPVFCADAIADPLTGVIAALAAVASRAAGGGHLLDVAMSQVAAAFAGAELGCSGTHRIDRRRTSWFVRCVRSGDEQRVLGPRAPELTGHARRLGADNDRWLARSSA